MKETAAPSNRRGRHRMAKSGCISPARAAEGSPKGRWTAGPARAQGFDVRHREVAGLRTNIGPVGFGWRGRFA